MTANLFRRKLSEQNVTKYASNFLKTYLITCILFVSGFITYPLESVVALSTAFIGGSYKAFRHCALLLIINFLKFRALFVDHIFA